VILTHDAQIAERVKYSAYGIPFGMPFADTNADGTVGINDQLDILGWWGTDEIRGDFNLDGTVGIVDFMAQLGNWGTTLGWGALSNIGNRKGYAGYEFDPTLQAAYSFWHVRRRVLNSDLGRWLTRDPIGYADGANLYQYVSSNPLARVDSTGLGGTCGPGDPTCTLAPGDEGRRPKGTRRCSSLGGVGGGRTFGGGPQTPQAPTRFRIKCKKINPLPGSHCRIDFGDGDECDANPPNPPSPFGPITPYCGPSRQNPVVTPTDPNDPFGGERTTDISCPPNFDYGAAKECIEDAMKKIGKCKIPYELQGPNSNSALWGVYQKCMAKGGCKLVSGRGDPGGRSPRTAPGAPPIGWHPDPAMPISKCLGDKGAGAPGGGCGK